MAKKLPITSDLHTATSANHPDSPDQTGQRTMSGRHNNVKPLVGTERGPLGGGSLPRKMAPASIGKAKNSKGY